MGYISKLAKARKEIFPGREAASNLWRETFGGTTKETPHKQSPPVAGGSYARSVLSNGPAIKRLVGALRSRAPGNWSDDRYSQTDHFKGMVYVGVHRVCTQLQQAEFQVFRKDPNSPEGKRPVLRHDPPEGGRFIPPYKLVELLEKPNRQDSFGIWMYRLGQQLKLTGTALCWMLPTELGIPSELYPIPTAIAIPQPAINPEFPDGYWRIQPVYPYGPFSSYPTPSTSVGAPIDARWMLRWMYPHPYLRYDGFSPLTGLQKEIDEFEMIGKSRHYKLRRGSNPDAVLNASDSAEGLQPLPEPEIDRIHAEWENETAGPENHGKLIIGTPGYEFEPWGGPSPKDMDYPQGWEQLAGFILGGGFGITKPAAGMTDDSSYATLFATLKQLHLVTLKPDCDMISAGLTRDLAPFFGDDLIVEIRCPRIDDHEIVFTKIDKLSTLKGMPKSVIKLALNMMEIPATKEVVEELSQAGQEGQPGGGMIPQQPGQVAPQPNAAEPGGLPETEQAAIESVLDEEELANEQPNPGKLSEGALGPRKYLNGHVNRLNGYQKKSMYDLMRKALPNGKH